MLGGNKKTIGYDSDIVSPPAGLSQYALDWQSWIIANGGTIPAATLLIFDNYLFKPAAANGNILNQLDRLNIYCGLNGYQIAANTNLIKNAHLAAAVSSPTFDNNGYKSTGSGYLDLNYIPSSQGVTYTLNSASIGIVVKNPVYTGTRRAIGVSATNRNDLNFDSGLIYGFLNNVIGVLSSSIQPTVGNVFVNQRRTASNARTINVNGTIDSNTTASTALPNMTQYELTSNNGIGPAGNYDDKYHLASWNGSGNLDESALMTILNNLFAALGV